MSGHLLTEMGYGPNIGLWSIRSLLDRSPHRERGREGMRIQNGLYQSSELTKFGATSPAGRRLNSELDPCLAWVRRE